MTGFITCKGASYATTLVEFCRALGVPEIIGFPFLAGLKVFTLLRRKRASQDRPAEKVRPIALEAVP